MSRRITLERVLRDDNDANGQTVRTWIMQRDDDLIMIRAREGSDFILIRKADAQQFHEDLQAIARA